MDKRKKGQPVVPIRPLCNVRSEFFEKNTLVGLDWCCLKAEVSAYFLLADFPAFWSAFYGLRAISTKMGAWSVDSNIPFMEYWDRGKSILRVNFSATAVRGEFKRDDFKNLDNLTVFDHEIVYFLYFGESEWRKTVLNRKATNKYLVANSF